MHSQLKLYINSYTNTFGILMELDYIITEYPLPGLIQGMFTPQHTVNKTYQSHMIKHVNKFYGDHLNKHLEQFEISYGTGIQLKDLLISDSTCTRYEIDAKVLRLMPKPKLRRLCNSYRLLVTDLFECGAEIAELISSNPDLEYMDTVFLSSGMDDLKVYDTKQDFTQLPDNTTLINLPICLYVATSHHLHKGYIASDNTQENGTLVPIYKPRSHRLTLLNKFDQAGILSECDWSLAINANDYTRASDLTSEQQLFLDKYSDMLPKFIEKNNDVEDTLSLSGQNYKWHVVTESFIDRIEITEKIFQAFLLQNPPLIVAAPGYIDTLISLGFIIHADYEDYDLETQIDNIINIIKNKNPNRQHLEHNQQLCLDIDYWSKVLVESLKAALTRQ